MARRCYRRRLAARERAQDLLETLLRRRWSGSLGVGRVDRRAEDAWHIFCEPGS